MEKGKIKALELLKATRFLNLYKADYKNKYDQDKTWYIASRKNEEVLKEQYFEGKEDKADAVVLVALHEEEEKIVVIKQYRVPLNDYVYELPAGLIDGDEAMEVAAKRELKEETGLDLIKIHMDKSNAKAYFSAGMTEESGALVYCTCKGIISKDGLEDDEDIEAMLLSREDAKKLIESNCKMDIKAFIILQSFIKSGLDILN